MLLLLVLVGDCGGESDTEGVAAHPGQGRGRTRLPRHDERNSLDAAAVVVAMMATRPPVVVLDGVGWGWDEMGKCVRAWNGGAHRQLGGPFARPSSTSNRLGLMS